MAFATPQELVASKQYNIRTIAQAQEYIDKRLEGLLHNQNFKWQDRPWKIVDMNKLLDPKQAWIGFEYETGFDNKAEYDKFIHFLWGMNHIALDREGTGDYPIEVAYPPQEVDDILKNGSMLENTVKFVKAQKMTPALNPTTYSRRDVGIHAGISTEKFRKAEYDAKYSATKRLDKIILSLSDKQKNELYGRSALHWGGAHYRETYIEVKVWKAIPDLEHVQKTVACAIRMTQLLDYLLDNPTVGTLPDAFGFLSGAVKLNKAV